MSEKVDSFPFLHLARRLALPYADVLLFAEDMIGRETPGWAPNPHHIAVCERLGRDAHAQHAIEEACRAEQCRRQMVIAALLPPQLPL